MKTIIKCLSVLLILISCIHPKKDYLTISGKVENQIYDSITIYSYTDKSKRIIQLSEDGNFKDTLKIINGFHGIFIGKNFKQVPFQNGDDIIMNVDAQNFYETISFSGKGARIAHLCEKFHKQSGILYNEDGFFDVAETTFKNRMNNHFSKLDNELKHESLDSAYISVIKNEMKQKLSGFYKIYEEHQYIKQELTKGNPSPKFVDFSNFNGGKTSLNDLKGKFVYINFWGRYCGPCIDEFPSLKELIKQYKNKPIEFVSISSEVAANLKEWEDFQIKHKLKGIQLYTDFRRDAFTKEYRIKSVPRYVLIDPEGNIVDAKTFSPSDPKLIELFDSLNI